MKAKATNGRHDHYGYQKKAPGLGFVPMTTTAILEPPALDPSLAVSEWVDGPQGENGVVKENRFLYWKFYTKQYKRSLASL